MKFESDKDYICTMNRVSDEVRDHIDTLVQLYLKQQRDEKSLQRKMSPQVVKRSLIPQVNKESFYNLALMIVCWMSTSFTYYLVIFLVKYLPGNLYMNQVVSGFSVLGYLIVPFLAMKFDNRVIMVFGYLLTLVCLVLMALAEGGYLESYGEFGYSIVFLLFRSGVCMVFISLFVIH